MHGNERQSGVDLQRSVESSMNILMLLQLRTGSEEFSQSLVCKLSLISEHVLFSREMTDVFLSVAELFGFANTVSSRLLACSALHSVSMSHAFSTTAECPLDEVWRWRPRRKKALLRPLDSKQVKDHALCSFFILHALRIFGHIGYTGINVQTGRKVC